VSAEREEIPHESGMDELYGSSPMATLYISTMFVGSLDTIRNAAWSTREQMRKCGAVKEMRDLDVVLAHVDTALAHLHTTNHKAFEALGEADS